MELINKFINRETILYGIFGVMTSVLNVVLFSILLWLNMDYRIANFVTLVVTKLAAYVCNKNFVFKSKTGSWRNLAREFGRFLIARGATMVLDYIGLIMLVELARMNKLYGKIIVTVVVIIINYFVGKGYVFKKERTD